MTSTTTSEDTHLVQNSRSTPIAHELIGVLSVLAGAAAVLAFALAHGSSLGPYDLLSRSGLTKQSGVLVHNTNLGDQIDYVIPWTNLAWHQVHSGQLPLWNPYSGLGMPLAFNWQSAPFSVPSLLGYLFPLRLAYTVQLVSTLAIAGSGAYVFARTLRLTVFGAVTAGLLFELSGPVVGWLGWPITSAAAWAGWLFAAGIFVIRGRHRARSVGLMAVVLACVFYAGSPEVVVLLGSAFILFVVVILVARVPRFGGSGPIGRPALDLVLAGAAGLALGAPVVFPSAQLAANARRSQVSGLDTLSIHDLVHLLFQGFDGLPIAGSRWFSPFAAYPPSAAYVGVIGLVLAVTAVALRRKEPEILGLGLVAVLMAAFAFARPVAFLGSLLPAVGTVHWNRGLLPMAFALAVLAGAGMDLLVRAPARRIVCYWVTGAFVAAGVVVTALWAFGRGNLPPAEATVRVNSFVWPSIQIGIGLLAVGAVAWWSWGRSAQGSNGRVRRHVGLMAGVALLLCEALFLIASGAPLESSSPKDVTPTPAVVALQRAVGNATVGFGLPATPLGGFPSLGILPNANAAFGIHELDETDPMTPRALFSGPPAFKNASAYLFGPAISSLGQARRYGVGFVLEPLGHPGPVGSIFDKRIGDESLYRIPGSGAATLTPMLPGGLLPPAEANGTPVKVSYPDAASWRISTDRSTAQVLRLRLLDVPGWTANIDGHPLTLSRFQGVMFQARIPPGHHTIELTYWPPTFTAGLVVAGVTVVLVIFAAFFEETRRRKRERVSEMSESRSTANSI
jgi:hypothetical protein